MILFSIPSFLVFASLTAIVSAQSVAQFECTPRVLLRPTRNGKPSNCARALMSGFPNGPIVGQFHRFGELNAFRLPRKATVGDCEVTVDLNQVERVQGSWQEVWTLATTLSTACTYYISQQYPGTAVTGGFIHGGLGNGLSIIMGRPLDLVGNGTTEEATDTE
ncbi:MAG: hypothetical protein Q9186_000616 [Xanthomendoza sp. 1 TL-2023]